MTVPGQFVVCALGSEQYGLPIAQVREIVRYVEPRPVAADDDGVRGVIGLRGRLLPVHDLAVRLALPGASSAAAPPAIAKIVVAEAGGELAGLLVDDVVEVAWIAAEQVEEVPAAVVNGRVAEVAKLGDARLVLLLDAVALLTPESAPAPAEVPSAIPSAAPVATSVPAPTAPAPA